MSRWINTRNCELFVRCWAVSGVVTGGTAAACAGRATTTRASHQPTTATAVCASIFEADRARRYSLIQIKLIIKLNLVVLIWINVFYLKVRKTMKISQLTETSLHSWNHWSSKFIIIWILSVNLLFDSLNISSIKLFLMIFWNWNLLHR